MELKQWQKKVYDIAKSKGWYDKEVPQSTKVERHMLMVSEIAEATEEVRNSKPAIYQYYDASMDDDFLMELEIKNEKVLVDSRDWERLEQYSWYTSNDGHHLYLKANVEGSTINFHDQVVNPPKNMMVDHIDGNTLNNLRNNLRVCNASQNQANQSVQKIKKTSQFKGVHYSESKQKWISQIGFEKKRKHIGNFNTEIEAAKAYDEVAIDLFGQFAKTNITDNVKKPIIILPADNRWFSSSKTEGEAIELADAVIRIMDYFEAMGWDLEEAIRIKSAYNETRPYRHGGKTI
jgi:hypothetical protein